jgi:hypothetical protein
MTRKGELSRGRLNREWPHHLALPAEAVRGPASAATVRSFATSLSAAALIYHLRQDDRDLVVFCSVTAEAAQAFAERFGGELLPVDETRRRW